MAKGKAEKDFMSPRIKIDQAKIKDFFRRNHIRKLAFFGSVLRDDFGPESDAVAKW